MAVVLRRYCPVCKTIKPAEKQPENTAMHVILCLCTGLIWLLTMWSTDVNLRGLWSHIACDPTQILRPT